MRQGDLFGSACGPAVAQVVHAADPVEPGPPPGKAARALNGAAPARASRRSRTRVGPEDGAAVRRDTPAENPVAAGAGPAQPSVAGVDAAVAGAREADAPVPEMPMSKMSVLDVPALEALVLEAPIPETLVSETPGPEPIVPETPLPAPVLLRADPLAFRPKDRPDGWLYHVTTGEAAAPLLRHGLSPEAAPPLLERSAVAARLASLAEELGAEAEHPGALAVLRLRRHAVLDRLRAVPGGGWVLTDAAPPHAARR